MPSTTIEQLKSIFLPVENVQEVLYIERYDSSDAVNKTHNISWDLARSDHH